MRPFQMGMRAVLPQQYQTVMSYEENVQLRAIHKLGTPFLMCMSVEKVGRPLFPRQSNHKT